MFFRAFVSVKRYQVRMKESVSDVVFCPREATATTKGRNRIRADLDQIVAAAGREGAQEADQGVVHGPARAAGVAQAVDRVLAAGQGHDPGQGQGQALVRDQGQDPVLDLDLDQEDRGQDQVLGQAQDQEGLGLNLALGRDLAQGRDQGQGHALDPKLAQTKPAPTQRGQAGRAALVMNLEEKGLQGPEMKVRLVVRAVAEEALARRAIKYELGCLLMLLTLCSI